MISRKSKVRISTILNFKTNLEGYNIIGKNSVISNSKIGHLTYISNNCELSNALIGRFTSIGINVKIVSADHPTKTFVSSHPAFYSTAKQAGITFCKVNLFEEHRYFDKNSLISVKIGNDVWIGSNVIIMGGIEIGDGAVIATGSIVTKDVKPYEIVGGCPAKNIKFRFSNEDIEFLRKLQWWNKPIEWFRKNAHLMVDINILKSKYNDI